MNRRGLLGLLAAWMATPWRLLASQPTAAAKQRVVIFIPGTMGSTLQVNGKDLWGKDANTIYDTLLNNAPLLTFAGKPYPAPEVIDTLRLPQFSPMFDRDLYAQLIRRLRRNKSFSSGDVVLFPYDWRQDLRATVNDLKKLLETTKRISYTAQGRAARREGLAVDLIGHSQGGLVAFLAVAQSVVHADNVRSLTLLGAPLRGSAKAFTTLFDRVDISFLEETMFWKYRKNYHKAKEGLAAVVRTFPSLYQQLPPQSDRFIFDRTSQDWTNPLREKVMDPKHRDAANELHGQIEAALKAFPVPRDRVRIIYGDGLDTPTNCYVRSEPGTYRVIRTDKSDIGDGTVHIDSVLYNDQTGGVANSNKYPNAQHDLLGDHRRILDVVDTILT